MKKLNVSLMFTLALSLTIAATGCGKGPETPQDTGTVISGVNAIPTPAGVPAGQLPLGCYNNGSTTCAPCPVGFTSNGSYCAVGGNTANNCAAGSFFNGYSCQQIGVMPTYPGFQGCPYGSYWSNYYYACISTSPIVSCKTKQYLKGLITTYVCM